MIDSIKNCQASEPPRIEPPHHPLSPYCLKYYTIEHRVFPRVTRACKGVPLETVETAKHYMEKAETTQGLNVVVRMIDKIFRTGRKYAQDFKKNTPIQFDDFLPKWNYTAVPQINLKNGFCFGTIPKFYRGVNP